MQFQISGRLPDGQTRAAGPSNSVGSRKGAKRAGPRAYNITSVDLKTFIFSTGSKSRSTYNEVLGPLPKRLLFTMIKNADLNGSVETNPYKFRHINEFSLYVIGTRVPTEGLTLDMDHEKTYYGL